MNNLVTKSDKRLFAFDFDGTLAQTFQKSQSGMCVERAYLKSAQAMFGLEGIHAFHSIGGLQNRAPGELLKALIDKIGAEWCIMSIQEYFEDRYSDLVNLMPEGKGLPLVWNHENPYDVMTELFVRTKLLYLFQEIGTPFSDGGTWPRPMDGIKEFFAVLQSLGNCDIAILSSGHDQFVRRCFDEWRIQLPLFVLTDDDIRPMTGLRSEQRSKPSSYLFWLLVKEWAKHKEGSKVLYRFDRTELLQLRRKIIYFGDDLMRDGWLARRNGVPFYLYDPEGKEKELTEGVVAFRSWHSLAENIQDMGPDGIS